MTLLAIVGLVTVAAVIAVGFYYAACAVCKHVTKRFLSAVGGCFTSTLKERYGSKHEF